MRTATLASVCELLTDGTHYTPRDVGIGVPFLTVKDVSDHGLDLEGCSHISHEDYLAAKRSNCAPRVGDVLFSKDGTVGKVHLVKTETEFAVLSSLAILRPESTVVDAGYLAQFLRTPEALNAAIRIKTGSAIRRVILRDLGSLLVPLPSLEAQRRIAAILDQADMLRGKRREARALMSRLIDGLFHATFGDPATGGLDWPREPFDRACLDETSRSDKLQRGDYQVEGAYPVVDQGQAAIAGWSDNGDLLCRSTSPVIVFGDHTRNVKFVNFPFIIGADGAKVLKPTARFNELFFAHLLERMPIPDLGYSRHMREVKRLHFPCPPRALQDLYAEQAAEIARQTRQIEHHAVALDSLFASLQHRAFRGEL